MKANDLQIRIARKMKSGRGSMMITQDDLDTLVQCGAYTMLCNAATDELRQRKAVAPRQASVSTVADRYQPEQLPDAQAELERVNSLLYPQTTKKC